MSVQDLRISMRLSKQTVDTFDWLQERIPAAENHSHVLRRCTMSFGNLLEVRDRPTIKDALEIERNLKPVEGSDLRANFRVDQNFKDRINLAQEFFGANTEKEAITRILRLFQTIMSDPSLKPYPNELPNVIRFSENEVTWLFF
jgi:hypothetical protein